MTNSFKYGNTKFRQVLWEVRGGGDGLKDSGGFLEEVAFELSLKGGFVSGQWRGRGGVGLGHRACPRARQVWTLRFRSGEGLGLARQEVEAHDKVR